MVQWRPAGKDESPYDLTGETVIFAHFVERGLALPPSNFFHGLLLFYKLKAFHLTSNSLVHIFAFSFTFVKHLYASSPISIFFAICFG
jgi:hypothetical protein